MKVYYKHPITKKVKEVKRGYSWTTFLFGCIPAAIRGDWKWFMISAGLAIAISAILNIFLPALVVNNLIFVGWAIWGGFYNKIYEQELISNGYEEIQL